MLELSCSTSISDYVITEADDEIFLDVLENMTDDADCYNNINNNNSNNNKDQYDYNTSDDDNDDNNSLLNKFDNDDKCVFFLSSDNNDNDTDSDNKQQQQQVVMDMDMDITTNIEQEENKNSNININSSTDNTYMMSDDDIIIEYDQSDLDLMREDISEDFFDDHNNRSINNYDNDASNYNRTDSTTSTTMTNCRPSLSFQVGTYDDTFDATASSQWWLTGKLNSYKATSLASYSSGSDAITSTATTTIRKSSSRNHNNNNKRNNFYANKNTKHKHWSFEEDENLKLEVHEFLQQQEGGRGNINNNVNINWEHIAISKSFRKTRSIIQCKNRWCNHLQPGKKQGNWEQWEDDLIRSEVKRIGFGNWAGIAKHELSRRIPNQIRDRYVEYLDSANTYKKKTPWSKEEDQILFHLQLCKGNKWAEIRKELPGRSPNDIKNRYHNKKTALNKKEKKKMMFTTPFVMGI